MVKEAKNENELRDTAVIGSIGVGTHIGANHLINKMGLNGQEAANAAKSSTSLLGRMGSAMKSPMKAIGSTVRSQGFKKGLKIGAIGGAIGLVGDYAAVKINKAMTKESMDNKYLEKVAEMYSVKGHPGVGYGIYKTPGIQMGREDYHEYAHKVESHPVQHLPAALMLGGGGAAAYLAHKRGGRPAMAGMLVGGAGAFLGRHIADNVSHIRALESMKMVHPRMLEENQD